MSAAGLALGCISWLCWLCHPPAGASRLLPGRTLALLRWATAPPHLAVLLLNKLQQLASQVGLLILAEGAAATAAAAARAGGVTATNLLSGDGCCCRRGPPLCLPPQAARRPASGPYPGSRDRQYLLMLFLKCTAASQRAL